jgi:hypothetical protein
MGTSILNGEGEYLNLTDNYFACGDFKKGNLTKGFYVYPNGDIYQG